MSSFTKGRFHTEQLPDPDQDKYYLDKANTDCLIKAILNKVATAWNLPLAKTIIISDEFDTMVCRRST